MTDIRKLAEAAPTNGPEIIYLESEYDKHGSDVRLWCQDDDPSGSGYPWIKYVRHDIVAAKDAELTALRAKVKAQAEALKPFAALAETVADVDVTDAKLNAHFRGMVLATRRAAQEAT